MRGVFVTGTDTGVGKTVLAATLLAATPATTRYAKPVQTGAPPDDDRAEVLRRSGVDAGRAPDLGVRLRAPVSPHHAAALEGTTLAALPLAARVRAHDGAGGAWVVEGAGGLLTPLSTTETMLDLAAALGLPALVAVGARLGAINATLLTLRALDAARHPCLGIVLVGPEDPSLTSALEAFAPGRVLGRIAPLAPLDPATLRAAGAPLLAHPALARVLA